jgi:hypothetical protein
LNTRWDGRIITSGGGRVWDAAYGEGDEVRVWNAAEGEGDYEGSDEKLSEFLRHVNP